MSAPGQRLLGFSSVLLAAALAAPLSAGWLDPRRLESWLLVAAVWAAAHVLLAPAAFARRFVPPASPLALAGIRVWVCLVMLGYVVAGDLPATARLPRELLGPMGAMDALRRLPGFEAFLADPAALAAFQALTAAALVAAALGWLTRWTTPLAAVLLLVYLGVFRQYTYFHHQSLIGWYVLAALSATPCGDALSLDAWLRARRGAAPVARPAAAYAWGRTLCWTALAMPYFLAGLSKLRNGGLGWWSPDSLRGKVLRDSLQKGVFERSLGLEFAAAPDVLFAAIGLGTLLLEIAYLAVVVSRRARPWFALAAAGLHLGILGFQNFLFVDALLMQAILVDWRRLGAAVRRRLGALAGPPADPAADTAPGGYVRPALAFDLVVLYSAAWLFQLEAYPLTRWAMYSGRRDDSTIVYHRAWAETASGARFPAPYERCFPAPNFNPYIRYEGYAFDEPPRPELARLFFQACGAELNRRRDPGERIVAFEIERRHWDWRAEPAGEPWGRAVATQRIAIQAVDTLRD